MELALIEKESTLCAQCKGTGYRIIKVEGVECVAYSESSDGTKTLQVCDECTFLEI